MGCVVILSLRQVRRPGCSRCSIRIAPVSEAGFRVKFEWAVGHGAVVVGVPTSFALGLEIEDRGRGVYAHTYILHGHCSIFVKMLLQHSLNDL